MIKSSELDFKPVKDQSGNIKTGAVGPWACERHECTGDMQLQTFRKGPGDNLLTGLSMKVCFFGCCCCCCVGSLCVCCATVGNGVVVVVVVVGFFFCV